MRNAAELYGVGAENAQDLRRRAGHALRQAVLDAAGVLPGPDIGACAQPLAEMTEIYPAWTEGGHIVTELVVKGGVDVFGIAAAKPDIGKHDVWRSDIGHTVQPVIADVVWKEKGFSAHAEEIHQGGDAVAVLLKMPSLKSLELDPREGETVAGAQPMQPLGRVSCHFHHFFIRGSGDEQGSAAVADMEQKLRIKMVDMLVGDENVGDMGEKLL